MHIPDNYLSPSTCAVIGAAMIPVWAKCIKKINEDLSLRKIPSIALMSAFSFLIMMFNVPLPGGTTGHAVGATLVTLLVGPYAACISISVALFIQALFFGDGGIISFGVNAFNMAFVMPMVSYSSYIIITSLSPKKTVWKRIAIFTSAYVSITTGALLTAIEFGLQPLLFKDQMGLPLYAPFPLIVSIPAMMMPHLLVVGFIEAFVTLGVYSYIEKVSPSYLYAFGYNRLKPIYLMLLVMCIACPLGLIASGTAWGEWGVSEINGLLGFIPQGMLTGFSFNSLMPDYTISMIASETVGYVISAIAGVVFILAIFGVLVLFKKTIARKGS